METTFYYRGNPAIVTLILLYVPSFHYWPYGAIWAHVLTEQSVVQPASVLSY